MVGNEGKVNSEQACALRTNYEGTALNLLYSRVKGIELGDVDS